MSVANHEYRQRVALFRYGVIADLLHAEPDAGSLAARIRAKTEQSYEIPYSSRTRIGESTVYGWLRQYQQGGFDALMPKRRSDRGRARRMPVELVEALLTHKRDNPKSSVREVIAEVREAERLGAEAPMPASTVHRLFEREGLMQAVAPAPQDRRRFAYRHAGELWMSDVMHGPAVIHKGRRRQKTYLIAFIDDATRVIPHAAFDFSENTAAFQQVMKQAMIRRGVPRRLYVDNGACYRSHQLSMVCAKLNIALIHARPFQPAGKGKIERFFRTCRRSLVSRLQAPDIASLDTLNRKLWSWVEGEYHRTPHRGLDRLTPLDKWAQCGEKLRLAGPEIDFDELFLYEVQRRVMNDRTIRLNNCFYEVDAALVGQRVTVRYNPQATDHEPIRIHHDGQDAGVGRLVDEYANAKVAREATLGIRFHAPNPQPTEED